MHHVAALVRDSPSCLVAQPHISMKKRKRTLKYLDIRVLVHFAFAPSPPMHCASSSEDILLRAGCSSTFYFFKCIIAHLSLPTSNSWIALSLLIRRRSAVLPCWHFLLLLLLLLLFLSPPSSLSPPSPYLHTYPVLVVIFFHYFPVTEMLTSCFWRFRIGAANLAMVTI